MPFSRSTPLETSTPQGLMFNLIDMEAGVKADLVPMTREPDYRVALERRVRRTIEDEAGRTFAAWYAQPTDIIIGKLKAWHQGRSAKHPSDIYAMLVFALSGLSDVNLDTGAIATAAEDLGPEAAELWHALIRRAEDEVHRHQNEP